MTEAPSIKDALEQCATWLRNGDYATRGGLIEMDRLASVCEAALATLQPDGTEQASNEQGNVGKGLPNDPENDPKNENIVAGERREEIARITADPGDGTVKPDLAHVLARGFDAMGWDRPASAAEDMIEAIASGLVQDEAAIRKAAVTIPLDVAIIIDGAFLPLNPNKLRSAGPETIEAAKLFKQAIAAIRSARDGGAET